MTLTKRLLLLALISVLPAIVMWTYTEVSLRRAREAEVNDLVIRQARVAGSELERIFDGIHSLLIAVDEAPGPTCPRCWRRTGEAACSRHDPNLCKRCAAVVEKLPLHNGAGVAEKGGVS